MMYPRMNKEDYPPIPDVITNEAELALVTEYLVFSAMKIEEMQDKVKNPLMPILEKRKLERIIPAALQKYVRLSQSIDDYQTNERSKRHGNMRNSRM